MRTWYWFMSIIRTRRLVPPRSTEGTDLVLAGVALVALRAVALFVRVTYANAGTDRRTQVRVPRRHDPRTRTVDRVAHVAVPGLVVVLRLRIFAPFYGRIGQ